MSIVSIFIIAVVLSMDAFAVSISCGIKMGCNARKKFLKLASYFGLMQGLMPVAGWYLGSLVNNYISNYAQYLSAAVFFILGFKTIYDSFQSQDTYRERPCECSGQKCVSSLAIATSIDAFIIGVVFSINDVSLWSSALIIGVTTFLLTIIGIIFGRKIGVKLGKLSGFCAGLLLIILAGYSFFN